MSGNGGSISGNSALQVIEAITQFVGGTQAVWNSITIPIPVGLVVYATDTTVVKMGDGVTLYANLPSLFTISSLVSLTNTINSANTSNQTLLSDVAAIQASQATMAEEITILQGQVGAEAPTTVISTSGNVAVLSGQYFIGIENTVPAATSVTLPPSPSANESHVIKDINGVAEAFNITIQGNGKQIDGNATYVVRTNFASVALFYNGTSWSLI